MDRSAQIHGHVAFAQTYGAVRVSESHYGANIRLPSHAHPSAYLSFVIAGTYIETVGRHELTCGPNVLRYHPLGEEHSDRFGPRGGSCLNLELSPELTIDDIVGSARPMAVDSLAFQALRLRREAIRNDSASTLVIEEITSALIDAYRDRARAHDTVRSAAPLRRAIDYMEAHLTERFTLRAVAQAALVHETHLARLFKQRLGITAGDYVRRRRIARAECELRSKPGVSASVIAASLGFADLPHFSRLFRRALGVTPSEYRRICNK